MLMTEGGPVFADHLHRDKVVRGGRESAGLPEQRVGVMLPPGGAKLSFGEEHVIRAHLLSAKYTPDLSASSCSQRALLWMVERVERMMVNLSVTPVEVATRE